MYRRTKTTANRSTCNIGSTLQLDVCRYRYLNPSPDLIYTVYGPDRCYSWWGMNKNEKMGCKISGMLVCSFKNKFIYLKKYAQK